MIQLLQKCRLWRMAQRHEKWVNTDHKKGKQAVITNMTFRNCRMPSYVLEGAIFKECLFENVDFATLRHANSTFVNCRLLNCDFMHDHLEIILFDGCIMSFTRFNNSKMDGVKFKNCVLDGAMFADAKMARCEIKESSLCYTNFTGAELYQVDIAPDCISYTTVGLSLACPEEGEFTAYKKVLLKTDKYGIAKLLVPAKALRSSATTRKCRVSEAKVLSITSLDGHTRYKSAQSPHYHAFMYHVGETVIPDQFNLDRWNECSNGIHCFITRIDAVNY